MLFRSSLAASVHEAIQELNAAVGFTPEVQELAKQGVKLSLKAVGSSPKLAAVLKTFIQEKEKFFMRSKIPSLSSQSMPKNKL